MTRRDRQPRGYSVQRHGEDGWREVCHALDRYTAVRTADGLSVARPAWQLRVKHFPSGRVCWSSQEDR